MEHLNTFKIAIVAVFAGVSSWLGWFGWLAVIFTVCLATDWVTGTMLASKNNEWNSKVNRQGIWNKFGSIVAVLVNVQLCYLHQVE